MNKEQPQSENQEVTYQQEASLTTKPTKSATTAKVGVSVEIPSSNMKAGEPDEGNKSLSMNKVRMID